MVTLTPQQVGQYHRDGFLVLRAHEHKLVDPEQLQQWTAQVKSWPKEKGKWMPYEEINSRGEPQLLRTEKFVDYHQEFHDFLCGQGMANLLKQLSGEDMLLFKDKINYKLPLGNGFSAHLDAPAYSHIGPARTSHLTANLAVDPATLANGCLEVVPGSHQQRVPCSHGGHITPEWEAAHAWHAVPLSSGDVLLFGSLLAHRSGPNGTGGSRSMVYATYAARKDGEDLRERYYVDRRKNFPPEGEREVGRDYSVGWRTYAFAAPFSSRGMGEAAAAAAEGEGKVVVAGQ